MYKVFQIANGVTALLEQNNDFNAMKQYAVTLSRIKDAVYYIVRDNGIPIVYLYRGEATVDAPAIMAQLSKPTPPPLLELEPPVPEENEPSEDPPGLQELIQHIPRRRRKPGPEEIKTAMAGPAEHKAFPVTVTDINETEGLVTAIVSVFGIIDDGDDIIHPGSFIKTLAERGNRIRVLNSHNARDILNVIGKQEGIREITREELPANILAKYPNATGGLETITRYMLDDPTSSAVFKRIKGGFVDEYSIGFDIVQSDNEKLALPDGKAKVVRNIRQIRLWEYSPVIWGMNPATQSVSIKSVDDATDETDAPAVPLLAEWLTTDIMMHCQTVLAGMKWFGVIDELEHDMITQLCNERIERIKTDMPLGLALRPLDNSGMMMFGADGSDETKAGRVLSERNFTRIQQAADLLTDVLSAASLLEESAPEGGDSADKGMVIEIPPVPEQLLNDGPHDEPEKAPTSDEAGPRGDGAPTRRADLEDRLSRLLVED